MKKQNRNTDFWDIPTPAKVGPGSYEISTQKKSRYNSAPFSKAEAKTNSVKLSPNTMPGPGSYSPTLEWVKSQSPSSSFLSNLPRTGQIPIGSLNLVQSPITETPGPGYYNTEIYHLQRPSRKFRQLSMIVEASVSSIPYRPGNDQILGPTSYNPKLSLIKPKTITTNFSSSSSKRDMLNLKHNLNVGPGKYMIDSINEKKKESWIFSSKVSKNTDIRNEPVPGPGAYNPKLYTRQPRVLVEGFGSTTERDISLTNDPHRPYANSGNFVSTNSNDSYEQSSKQDFFREKYLNPKTPIPKPAFGTSEKRESKWVNTSTVVGPGDYQTNKLSSHSPRLPMKSPRFKENKLVPLPGPGSYEINNPTKNQVYLSKSIRFKEEKNDKPENYIPHQPWKIKQNRACDSQVYESNLRFESSSPRFPLSHSESPGPGQYKVHESKISGSIIHSTEHRFEGHGSYIPQTVTDIDIGPGSYHKEAKLGKKTFNISPDIGDDRPWI